MISGPRKRKARQAEASADAPPQRNAGVPRRAKALTREGSEGTGSRSLEQPRRRLQHLYEVSKLLTRFENVETTVRAIIAIVNQTLALRTAILIFENAGRPQSLVWHGEGESAPQLHTAMSNARASYAYLAGPAGAGSTSSTSRAEVNEPAGQMFGSSSTKNFIAIPLVVEHSRIFGAFQLETVDRPDELDLLLINAVANQLAVALDRQAAIEAGQAAAEARTQHAEHRQITAEAARAHAESREAAARAEQMEAERRRDAARVEREAEELRRASAEALHERYEALVDNIDHAFVWEADARTLRVFYVSARAEMLLGYPRQSWLTDPEFWMRRVHPEDRDELAQTFRRALAEKKDQRHDHRCVTADGRILWFHTGVHLAQANSPAPQLQGVSVDITPMKHAEEALREALEQAHRATRAREELLAIVSHDLKNPLSVIFMNTALMTRTSEADDRRMSRKLVETIQRHAERMNRLIQDLLDTAAIDAGKLNLEPRPLSVVPLVQDTIEAMQPLAESRSLHLVHEVRPDLPAIFADASRLQQVFANLIGNAIKFTSDDGTITVRAEAMEDVVQFSIADTGSGIPEADLPHLFERFWQARRTARQGTGLGLSIVKGIVLAHGGRVWVTSRLGEGTTFFFTLPIAPYDVSEAAEDESVEGIARAQILQGELAKHSMN